jgi:hypothetical protein
MIAARKNEDLATSTNKLVDRHGIENLDVISRRLDSFSKILQARQLRNFNRMDADQSPSFSHEEDDC